MLQRFSLLFHLRLRKLRNSSLGSHLSQDKQGLVPGHQLPGISGLPQERDERKPLGREWVGLAGGSFPMHCRTTSVERIWVKHQQHQLQLSVHWWRWPVTQALKIRVSCLKSLSLHFCWWKIVFGFLYSLVVFSVHFKSCTLFYYFVFFTILRKYLFPVSQLLGSFIVSWSPYSRQNSNMIPDDLI